MASVIQKSQTGKRSSSRISIYADNIKVFNQLTIGDKITGNFSGVVETLDEPESGEKGNPKQMIEIIPDTVYIDKSIPSSESKDKSMDQSYDKARRLVKKLHKTLNG